MHSHLRDHQSRSIIRLSRLAPLPSMLILIFASVSKIIQSPVMNSDPWLVLKMSSVPCFANTFFSAAIQNAASRCRETPSQNFAAEPVQDRYKIQETTAHQNISDICAPNRIRSINHHVPRQIRPDFMPQTFVARLGLLVNWDQ
jgi:hypothetical protein